MKGLDSIPDRSVDCIITDPPYGIDYYSRYYKDGNPFTKIEGDYSFSDAFVRKMMAKLKLNCCSFIFCDIDYSWLQIKQELGDMYKSTIVWAKNNWTAGDLTGDFGKQYELIIYAVKGNFKFTGKRHSNIWNFNRVPPTDLKHPTQKPQELIEQMIEIGTKEGDLVLDPFIGSGTTACACKKLNRNFIGFELNPDYCKIANERLANTFVTKKNYGGYFK
jgi:DNA modification methylase